VRFRFFWPSQQVIGLDSGPNVIKRIVRNRQDNIGRFYCVFFGLIFGTFLHVFGYLRPGIVVGIRIVFLTFELSLLALLQKRQKFDSLIHDSGNRPSTNTNCDLRSRNDLGKSYGIYMSVFKKICLPDTERLMLDFSEAKRLP
jgi:hypothetical protein